MHLEAGVPSGVENLVWLSNGVKEPKGWKVVIRK